ncbi:uncharacterized protein LOC126322702 [Schistocerca gregaria]|uniref:uncharacterized protein LOC126322702 n=1 Tax=Schistocerca gregaria TaxID=7010 RepID=UPI00211F2C27|nr:uncharacterized protein LOC126322702 [Schistocerca gregaria]
MGGQDKEDDAGDFFLLPEWGAWCKWKGVEVVTPGKKLEGFRLYVCDRWVASGHPWMVVEKTGDKRDELAVSLVRCRDGVERGERVGEAVALWGPWLYGFEVVETRLGRLVVHRDVGSLCGHRARSPGFAGSSARLFWRLWWIKGGQFKECEKDFLTGFLLRKLGIGEDWSGGEDREVVVPYVRGSWAKDAALFYKEFEVVCKEGNLLGALKRTVKEAQAYMTSLAYYQGPVDGCFYEEFERSLWWFQVEWNAGVMNGSKGCERGAELKAEGCLDKRTYWQIRRRVEMYREKLRGLGYVTARKLKKHEGLRRAVCAFQSRAGLKADGRLDARTRCWIELAAKSENSLRGGVTEGDKEKHQATGRATRAVERWRRQSVKEQLSYVCARVCEWVCV